MVQTYIQLLFVMVASDGSLSISTASSLLTHELNDWPNDSFCSPVWAIDVSWEAAARLEFSTSWSVSLISLSFALLKW